MIPSVRFPAQNTEPLIAQLQPTAPFNYVIVVVSSCRRAHVHVIVEKYAAVIRLAVQ